MEIISIGYDFRLGYDFRHGKDLTIFRPLGLREYLFLIIRSTALFEIDGQKLQILPDSMILINKNMPHSFSANSDIFINDWITFTLNESEHLSNFGNIVKFNTFFTSPDVSVCSEIIKLICAEKNSSSILKKVTHKTCSKSFITSFEKIRKLVKLTCNTTMSFKK